MDQPRRCRSRHQPLRPQRLYRHHEDRGFEGGARPSCFDVAFGGARRDEEKSRAKERIFSFRSADHRWDPKHQRPELWSLYNTRKNKGESIRVFPLSNWTELDIWQYIARESIALVPLYFAALRPTVRADGLTLMVDDERMRIPAGQQPEMRMIRSGRSAATR